MGDNNKGLWITILVALLLWLYGPQIIPNSFNFIKPLVAVIIILAIIWIIIGRLVIQWFATTSKNRRTRRIEKLMVESAELRSYRELTMNNPQGLTLLLGKMLFDILPTFCVGLIATVAASTNVFGNFVSYLMALFAVIVFNIFISKCNKAYIIFDRLNRMEDYELNVAAEIARLSTDKGARKRAHQLAIRRAIYRGQNIPIKFDVTYRVRAKVVSDRLDYLVSNSIIGRDPAPGAKKELEVEFSYEGKKHRIVVLEGEKLSIP